MATSTTPAFPAALAQPYRRRRGDLPALLPEPIVPASPKERLPLWILFVDLLATIQFVWFYVNRVTAEIKIVPYEQGLERTPFQYRMLLMYPMRWAHSSPLLNHIAAGMKHGWFPHGARPEGVLQAAIDLVCVAAAGIAATKLYSASSRSRLFTPVLYPLTLVMAATTYAVLTMHQLRFLYDLPSLAFFSVGMYLIYARKHPAWFAVVFLVGTVNRETTLFLLAYFALSRCLAGRTLQLERLRQPATWGVLLPLLGFWVGWHLWAVRHFATNPNETPHKFLLNMALILSPPAWPQLLASCGYLIPFVLIFRRSIKDDLLRTWMWVLLPWTAFMLYYGLVMEIRIFGELIPYIACTATLIFEERLLERLSRVSSPGLGDLCISIR